MPQLNYKVLLPVVLLVIIGLGYTWYMNQEDDSPTTLFRIGTENGRSGEFKRTGFENQTDFTCTIGDFSNNTFPTKLYRENVTDRWRPGGVENIVIIFTLDRNYGDVVFRLARSGSETTVVTVDGEEEYTVTATMVGSSDNGGYGSYNLELGTLKKGKHQIMLTCADDGNGNGAFTWDALILFNSPS